MPDMRGGWRSTRRPDGAGTRGDFKIDQTPLDGEHVDFQRLAQAGGGKGVLVLLGDSTNVERHGYSGSERDVTRRLRGDLHERARADRGAMFASSLYRMQILVDLADQFERRWRSSARA
jgi:ribonuclease J